MIDLVEKFSGINVLVIGDVMLDRYWWGEVNRISPEAPVPVVRLRGESLAAGGAANVAANIAGLGATPLLLGAIGLDAEADELKRALVAAGIGHERLIPIDGSPTIVKTRIVAHSQQVVRVDKEELLELSPTDERAVRDAVDEAIAHSAIVIISDYGKGFLTRSVIEHLIEAGERAGKAVIVDPKGKDYRKYAGAWLVTPNRREAAEASGLHEDSKDLISEAGRILMEEVGIRNVIITQGENGMTLFRPDGSSYHLPAASVETYDVTGAGDTVIATLALAIAAGGELTAAAELANIAAGEVVQHVGTTRLTAEMLRKALEQSKPSPGEGAAHNPA